MTNESILKDADGIYDEFATPEKAAESVKLKVGTGRRRYMLPVVVIEHLAWPVQTRL